jgi:hypothetical protein
MKNDRFLIVILGCISLFVVLALVLFLVRKQPQGYGPEDSPEGVVNNYVLALQEGDYQRAYGYLQEGDRKPDFALFQQVTLQNEIANSPVAVQLGQVQINGDFARVAITITHFRNDPFDRSWDETSAAVLTFQEGVWRITSMPYPYWGWDWYAIPK